MEKDSFKVDNTIDPTDEELNRIMEEVGKLIHEETLKVKKIHEQRLKEIFSGKQASTLHNRRT